MSGRVGPDSGRELQAAPWGESGAPEAVEVGPTLRRDPLAWLIALLGILVACYSVWWASGLGDVGIANRFTGAATVPAGILVIVGAIRLGRAGRLDPRTRRAWTIIAVALVSYGIGALIHFASSTVAGLGFLAPAVPIFEIATYPLAWIALAMLPRPTQTVSDVVLFSLDVAIVAWCAALLIWHFILYPAGRAAGADSLAIFSAAMYPVADLSLVFSVVAVVMRGLRASSQAALSVTALALTLVFVGDMTSGLESVRGTYTPGGLSGVFYSAAWFGLALAIYVQWRMRDGERPIGGLANYARSTPWLSYIAVAVAFIAPAIRDWNDPDMLRQHVPGTGLLMALVIARLAVTARQNATLAAAERERLAAAVDQAAEAMLTTDRAGHITYVNPAFTRITGFPQAEAIGRRPSFLREDSDPESLAEMGAALARGESWEGRLMERRRDGSPVEVDLAVAPLRDTASAIVGTVEVARDISRERTLEAQLAQAQRMEAVGRLAGGIAHDFNNILTAISGFSELASAGIDEDGPVAADLGQILKASDRAAALTRALLAFSRQTVLQPRAVDLNDVLAGLTPMLEVLMGEDVKLTIAPDPKLGPALTDRAQFEQVILNLAVNARDAMPGGGSLTIETANVELDAEYARTHLGSVAGPHVRLSVSDTGVGMTPEVLSHAFEPFFTTKARGKGTGLGLSTVIGVVQMSGGSIDVASMSGAGTVFTIHLPRVAGAAEVGAPAVRSRPTLGGSETILVAEDEQAVRVFIERVLSRAGYRVLAAANGPEALAMASTLPHLDLLFTDMVMPGMGGRELAAQLSATHPGARTLFASGYSNDALLHGVGTDGKSPYLAKPFTADALLTRVREVLDTGN
ncbi:MAG: ATP-binding protein [Candidatus Limnocylindrales bacterium]